MAYESETIDVAPGAVPSHVPAELVRTFDFRSNLGGCPHEAIAKLHQGPRIFYTPVGHQPRSGAKPGAWVLTKAEDIRYVMQHPELFSNAAPRAQVMGEAWRLIPIEVDPPEHDKWRALLNPIFSPGRLKTMEPAIRAWASELAAQIAGRGECNFLADFAEPYPIGIFLDLLGLPRSDLPMFREWVDIFVHDRARRGEIMQTMKNFIVDLVAKRRAHPGDGDLITVVTQLSFDGKPITDDDALGVSFLLFIGGLDTVVNSMTFYFRYFAENPERQAWLRAHPEAIPEALEELLRAFSVVTTTRLVLEDTELAGVQVKKGDVVTVSSILSTRDPDEFANPNEVDLTRSPNRHNAFGFGPHRCLGSHLARRELIIAIEEWFRHVPAFELQPGAKIAGVGGGVLGIDHLPIRWTAPGA
jgi:cytochrome P450